MFLITNSIGQILILIVSIILFIITYLLNKRTKVPKGVEVPEKCRSCVSTSCIIKIKDIEKIKKDLKEVSDNCNEDRDEKK